MAVYIKHDVATDIEFVVNRNSIETIDSSNYRILVSINNVIDYGAEEVYLAPVADVYETVDDVTILTEDGTDGYIKITGFTCSIGDKVVFTLQKNMDIDEWYAVTSIKPKIVPSWGTTISKTGVV